MWKCNLFLKKGTLGKIHSQNEGLDLVAILSLDHYFWEHPPPWGFNIKLTPHFGNDLWASPYVKIHHFCLITYHGGCWPS
jgi:hypothetical protein